MYNNIKKNCKKISNFSDCVTNCNKNEKSAYFKS